MYSWVVSFLLAVAAAVSIIDGATGSQHPVTQMAWPVFAVFLYYVAGRR